MVYNQITDGIKIKVSHRDDNLIMSEILFQKGAVFPDHIHTTDHSGYLLQGKIRIVKDGIPREMVKGDSWCIGKNICHYTEALEDSVVIEICNLEKEIPEEFLLACEMEI
jgi:quercetin dioxygenase-like cupin family protein